MSRNEDLIERSQKGDEKATEMLLLENERLIWAVVRRYIGRGTEIDDLYQLGCVGFIKAIQGFNPEFGTQFSTYAVPKIAGEIRRFIRDDGAIKVSRSLKEKAAQIRIVQAHLSAEYSREPSVREISAEIGLSVEEIAEALTATGAIESIQQSCGEDGLNLESTLSVPDSEEKTMNQIMLSQAIGKLSEREQLLIRLRYYHGLTQEQVAKIMGISQVQVSRLEKKALNIMKKVIEV